MKWSNGVMPQGYEDFMDTSVLHLHLKKQPPGGQSYFYFQPRLPCLIL